MKVFWQLIYWLDLGKNQLYNNDEIAKLLNCTIICDLRSTYYLERLKKRSESEIATAEKYSTK